MVSKVDNLLKRAFEQLNAGCPSEAAGLYREVLKINPSQSDALHLLGVCEFQQERFESAVELITSAIRIRPGIAAMHHNLGEVYRRMGRNDAAVSSLCEAVQLKPEVAIFWSRLGKALVESNRLQDACEAFFRASILDNFDIEARHGLAAAHQMMGQLVQAEFHVRSALEIDPTSPDIRLTLASVLVQCGKVDEAIAELHEILRHTPDHAGALQNLGMALKDAGRPQEALRYLSRASQLLPNETRIASNLIYTSTFCPGFSGQTLLEWQRRWATGFENVPRFYEHLNSRSTSRKLRIGYISPDFRDHVVGRNLIPIFREHDRSDFEIYSYSNVSNPDNLTEWFQSKSSQWRSIVAIHDDQVAKLVYEDQIDILVDLTLHMQGNRLGVLARKPAPLQMTFAGYPGGTLLETIDYRLTDPFLDPPGETENNYVEKSIRLAHSFWCYEPPEVAPQVKQRPLDQPIQFGCLNNFCKVNEEVIGLWARVLKALPSSEMTMLAPQTSVRKLYLGKFEKLGVDPRRIRFESYQPMEDYFALYHQIDIGLDTLPYNGHTTSLDSLWMGVPILTLVGGTVVGRAGLSQLTNLGMTEWIAYSPEQYIEIATMVSNDRKMLAVIRSTLRERMIKSPLMDAVGFTRSIEQTYRQAWTIYCESQS